MVPGAKLTAKIALLERCSGLAGTGANGNFQLNAARACSAHCGRLPLWRSLLGQHRLRFNSVWQLSKATIKTAKTGNHSEMSLSLNPVGGLRVLKTLLALTRGGLREPVARCSLPAHRHPLCALMPVNIGPTPALKADVGLTGVSERVKQLLFSTRRFLCWWPAAGFSTKAKRP